MPQKKPKFKIGDKIMAIENMAWAGKPMIVTHLYEKSVVARHPSLFEGAFSYNEVAKYDKHFCTLLTQLDKIESAIQEVKDSIWTALKLDTD